MTLHIETSIMDLPEDLLWRVLSLVPLGKSKIGMQGVCRKWREVLYTRAAHSLETWDEDCYLPSDPTMPSEGCTPISKKLLPVLVLVSYKSADDFIPDALISGDWLQWTELKTLEILAPSRSFWRLCPCLPSVTTLIIGDMDGIPSTGIWNPSSVSFLFPNLESLSFNEGSTGALIDVLADLQTLSSIKVVHIHLCCEEGNAAIYLGEIDFVAPPECRVSIFAVGRIEPGRFLDTSSTFDSISEGLCARLQFVTFDMGFESDDVVGFLLVNLEAFADCPFLESVNVNALASSTFQRVIIRGLGHLQKHTVLEVRNTNDGPCFSVEHANGWHASFPFHCDAMYSWEGEPGKLID